MSKVYCAIARLPHELADKVESFINNKDVSVEEIHYIYSVSGYVAYIHYREVQE